MDVVISILPAYDKMPAATRAKKPPPNEYKKSMIYPYVESEVKISFKSLSLNYLAYLATVSLRTWPLFGTLIRYPLKMSVG